MKNVLSKPGKFFVNTNGNLLIQNPQVRTPLSLSHVQRTRVEGIANTTTIQIVTGMTDIDQLAMMAEMSVEWLVAYLTPKTKELTPDWVCDVETDVYDLLKSDTVRGWWRNNHIQRDADMLPMLCHHHAAAFTYARNHKKYDRENAKMYAQAKTLEKYKTLHSMCMSSQFYHYHKLEDSYAKLW